MADHICQLNSAAWCQMLHNCIIESQTGSKRPFSQSFSSQWQCMLMPSPVMTVLTATPYSFKNRRANFPGRAWTARGVATSRGPNTAEEVPNSPHQALRSREGDHTAGFCRSCGYHLVQCIVIWWTVLHSFYGHYCTLLLHFLYYYPGCII